MLKSTSLRSSRRMLSLAVTVALLGLNASPVRAQEQPDERMQRALQRRLELQQRQVQRQMVRGNIILPNGAQADGEAKATGVFVRDSAVAGEKLALAERMERLKEWDTSAEVYQEVLDQYADRVLPIHNDEKGQPDRFGSVTSVVQDRLAAWPEEGRSIYLSRYELVARRLLESSDASNRAELMKVVNRYFLTTAGRDAAVLLIESYFDHAEFIAAAMLCDRLLEKHPQVSDLAPLLLTRSALSWHLAGEKDRAAKHAAQLAERFGSSTDTIGGKSKNLSDVVRGALATPRQTHESSAIGWPVPFGSNDHTALARETVDTTAPRIWAKLESIRLRASARVNNPQNENEAEMQPVFQRQRDLGAATGILPAVDGGQMFFQDNSGIYGYDLQRGGPLLGWLAAYPGTGKFSLPGAASTPRGVQMTTTLTDRYVLAILGQAEAMNFGGMEAPAALYCLDRNTGKVAWKVAMAGLATDDEALRTAKPAGSVLVAGDSVYVVARNRRPGSFEDSYLCCFALKDGALRWSRHLASGNSTRLYVDYNMPPQNAGDSHLAYADGSLYISTDMGAIASVNAADGALAWLSVYPRPLPTNPQWATMNINQNARVTPAFVGNPVIVANGLVISLPGDADHLFVHDAVTGELRGSVSMTRPPDTAALGDSTESFEVLVGLVNNQLLVSGSRSIALLDLARIQGQRQFKDVEVRWRDFRKQNYPEDTIRGRPFVTSSSIYVPTAWKLFRLSVDAKLALEMYPAEQDTWDLRPDEKPGNVIFANDSLIVAGPDQINIYSDLSLLRKRMESAVAADSRSAVPKLRYADALFNAGQTGEAIRWIDSSIQQLTSNGLVSPGPDRDRVFDMVMAMFRRLSVQERSEATLAALEERLTRTADTPMQQLALQLSRAHLAKRSSDFATAVDAYQRLIDEPSISLIRLRSSEGTMSAGDLAVTQIDQIIKAGGRGAYERVEARAQAALAAARASNDAAKLLAVLSAYPNSQAGQDSIALVMNATTSGGARSIDLLRRVGAMSTDPQQKLSLYRSLLQAELERGDIHSALGRARMIARLDPNGAIPPLAAPGGQSVSAATTTELVSSLQALAYDDEQRTLSNLNVPDAEPLFDTEHTINTKAVRTLLLPSNPRRDRVVAVSQDQRSVKIFEPANAVAIQSIDVPGLADSAQTTWRGDDLMLSVSQQVQMLDTSAGKLKWSFDPQKLEPLSTVEATMMSLDEQGLISPVTPARRQAIVMNPTARRPGQAIARGNRPMLMRKLGDVEQIGGWEADDFVPNARRDTIAYSRIVGDAVVVITSRGRVIGLDGQTGAVRWQSNFSDRPPSMVAVYDNLLVLGGNIESNSILSVYRSADGAQLINQTYSGTIQRRLNTLNVSREGYLAAVHSDFVDVFDLGSGDASPIATFDGQGLNSFAQTRSSEQVQFCADKLLVLTNDGRNQQVRMFDTLTLEPTTVLDSKTRQQVERQMMPIFPDGQKLGETVARMYVQKDRLLLRAGRDFMVYRVPVPDATPWPRPRDPAPEAAAMSSQSPLFVRDGILIFDWPQKQVGDPAASPRAQYFKRDVLENGRETGTLLGEFNLARPGAKVFDRIQPVDGGFYTVWTDNTLVFYPTRKPS